MLEYKPDAQEALDRFEAWWHCDLLDRPLLECWVTPDKPFEEPPFGGSEAEWFDLDARLDAAERRFAHHTWFAETFPSFVPNLGPDQLATVFGSELEYGTDTTWSKPVLNNLVEIWNLPAPNFECRHWAWLESAIDASLERGKGKWLTGYPDLHMNADLLAALREPQELCLDCAENSDLVRRSIEYLATPSIKAYHRVVDGILAAGQPTFTWMCAPHQGRMHVPSCDFSAMVSGELFRTCVVPTIVREIRSADRSIYHLDGPAALRHLDAILEIPELNAVQWVYGAGKGPASRWCDTYRRIQRSGKAILIHCESAEDALHVASNIGKEGAWYQVPEMKLEDAQRLLAEISK